MKKNKKKKDNTTKILLLVVLFLFVLGVILGFVFIKSNMDPVSSSSEEVSITIEDNWYGKTVLKYLQEENVIHNGDVAYYYAKLKHISLDFKAGTYTVDKSWSFENLVSYLSDGNNAIQDTVTIKFMEGTRLIDFANEISNNTNLTFDEIVAYWNDEDSIRSLMSDYPFLTEEMFGEDVKYLLEGYLFPDTYEFFANTTVEDVTRKILNETLSLYNEYKSDFEASDYSIHEIFTLASIVQRESGNPDDMSKVASVFYNRLNQGMQLQSSVTVCYALNIGLGEDWTKCEVIQDEEDPYNTYQIMGLPPGAICSFGKDALVATLRPADTNYLFFIGDVCGDGETIFAETYEEQLANQEEYLSCY